MNNGTLPAAVEAERAILGAVLVNPRVFQRVSATLTVDGFTKPRHRLIYAAMLALAERGHDIEPVAVELEVKRRGANDITLSDIAALGDCIATTAHIGQHVDLVRSKAIARALYGVGSAIMESSLSDPTPVPAQIDRARLAIDRVASLGQPVVKAVAPDHVLASDAFSTPQRIHRTGIAQLDYLIGGGLRAGTLSVLSAPTGAGKSGFCIHLARHMSIDAPVLIASVELDEREMAARIAAQAIDRPIGEILEGGKEMALEAAAELRGTRMRVLPLHDVAGIDDPVGLIESEARAMLRAMGAAPVVIVDYLQILVELAGGRMDTHRLEVGALAGRLRRLAQSLDSPVLAVSAVSRAYYGAAKKTNGLADSDDPRDYLAAAKESGGVEYAVANAWYLDVNGAVDQNGEQAARLAISKARHGRCEFVGLRFRGAYGSWRVDEDAAAQLGPTRRAMEDDARVLSLVRANRGNPLAWNDLRPRCGMSASSAIAARSRLIAAGEIVEVQIRRRNTAGQMRAVTVLMLAEDVTQGEIGEGAE